MIRFGCQDAWVGNGGDMEMVVWSCGSECCGDERERGFCGDGGGALSARLN